MSNVTIESMPAIDDCSYKFYEPWVFDLSDLSSATLEQVAVSKSIRLSNLVRCLLDNCHLREYLISGEYTCYVGDKHIVSDGDDFYVVKDNVIFHSTLYNLLLDNFVPKDITAFVNRTVGSTVPSAVILPADISRKDKKATKCKLYALLNADAEGSNAPEVNLVGEEFADFMFPSASFICIAALVTGKHSADIKRADIMTIANRIAAGAIVVLDYVADMRITLTAQEREKLGHINDSSNSPRDYSQLLPPKIGFTLVTPYLTNSAEWHRAGAVLFHFYRGKKSVYALVGTDEGAYFGVELPEAVNTVKDAIISLIPENIRKSRDVKRQGEWFIVPAAEKDVPKVEDCVATIHDSVGNIALPRKEYASACHYLTTDDGRISKAGRIYANSPCLSHEAGEHVDVSVKGWCMFYCNTAVRSVSVQGVD